MTRLLWCSDRKRVDVAGDLSYMPMTAAVEMDITPGTHAGAGTLDERAKPTVGAQH